MHPTLLLAVAFSGAVASQSTTTIGFLAAPFDITVASYTSIGASVAGINVLETTYEISCLDGAPSTLCNIHTPWTLIQGATTFSLTGIYTAPWGTEGDVGSITATVSEQCSFTHTTESVTCTASYSESGSSGDFSYSSSTSSSASFPPNQITYDGLLVTGGVNSFTAPQATKTPGAAASAGPAKAMITAAPLVAVAAAAAAAGML